MIRSLDCVSNGKEAIGLGLPKWALRVLGYSLFMWSSLILISASSIGADLLVCGFVYLAMALLCGQHRDSSLLSFIVFGLTLGLGYWSKAM